MRHRKPPCVPHHLLVRRRALAWGSVCAQYHPAQAFPWHQLPTPTHCLAVCCVHVTLWDMCVGDRHLLEPACYQPARMLRACVRGSVVGLVVGGVQHLSDNGGMRITAADHERQHPSYTAHIKRQRNTRRVTSLVAQLPVVTWELEQQEGSRQTRAKKSTDTHKTNKNDRHTQIRKSQQTRPGVAFAFFLLSAPQNRHAQIQSHFFLLSRPKTKKKATDTPPEGRVCCLFFCFGFAVWGN